MYSDFISIILRIYLQLNIVWRTLQMKTLNNLKLRIMVRAFRIRLAAGETFEDIAADYPALTADDLESIKEALGQ